MLGRRLDYLILRSISHDLNRATEEELNVKATGRKPLSRDEAAAKLRTHIDRFEGRFPLSPNLRYLDMGCGTGELTAALARLGCRNVTGIDMVRRQIDAARAYALQEGMDGAVEFVCADLNTWQAPQQYDVLLSFDAFEHIDDPKGFLLRMAALAPPGGRAVLGFGPLFYSPNGDHMSEFFRVKVPWRGVLFNEQALLRVRRECYRPTDSATRLQDIVGGLNKMRYSDFCRYVREAGWEFDYLRLNARLRGKPVIGAVSGFLTQLPILSDYFVFSVYAILRRQ